MQKLLTSPPPPHRFLFRPQISFCAAEYLFYKPQKKNHTEKKRPATQANAQHVCSQHLSVLPLQMNGMQRTQSTCIHAGLDPLSRKTHAKHSVGASVF